MMEGVVMEHDYELWRVWGFLFENAFWLLVISALVYFGVVYVSSKLFLKKRFFNEILIGIGIVFIVAGVAGLFPRETPNITRSAYLVTQFKVLVHYLQLLFVPFWQNVDHGISVSKSLIGWQELLGLIIFIGSLFVAYKTFRRHPLISFGIVWFFVTISVESSIIPIRDVMMEHRLYLPMFGFALSFIGLVYLLVGQQRSRYANYGFIGLLIFLGIITFNRNKGWASDYTLWKDIFNL